jgi:pyruvate formate lyase activating enzyme
MQDLPPTPPATLTRARRIALEAGLHYIYTGNVHDPEGGTTYCLKCHTPLIVRDWYEIPEYHLTDDGRCPHCGTAIAGRFRPFETAFGSRRIPVAMGM